MFPFETFLAIAGPLVAAIYLICAIGIWRFADSVFQAELPGATSATALEELMQSIFLLRVLSFFGFVGVMIIAVCVFLGSRRSAAMPKGSVP